MSCNQNGFPPSLPTAAEKRFKCLHFGPSSSAPETLNLGTEHARRRTRNRSELGLGPNNAEPTAVLACSWPPPKLPLYPRQLQLLSGSSPHFPLVIGLTGRAHGTCPGALGVARGQDSNWLCPHGTAPSRRLQRINNSTGPTWSWFTMPGTGLGIQPKKCWAVDAFCLSCWERSVDREFL